MAAAVVQPCLARNLWPFSFSNKGPVIMSDVPQPSGVRPAAWSIVRHDASATTFTEGTLHLNTGRPEPDWVYAMDSAAARHDAPTTTFTEATFHRDTGLPEPEWVYAMNTEDVTTVTNVVDTVTVVIPTSKVVATVTIKTTLDTITSDAPTATAHAMDIEDIVKSAVNSETIEATLDQFHQQVHQIAESPSKMENGIKGFVNLLYLDHTKGCKVKKEGRNHLFFYHPELQSKEPEVEESQLYYISTPWRLTYPAKLRKALEQKGFEMVDYHGTCEQWTELFDVTKHLVKRGHVDWKIAKGTDLDSLSPNEYILLAWNSIEDAMVETYPTLEICLIIAGAFTAAGILTAFAVWAGLWVMYRIAASKREIQEKQLADDVVPLTDDEK